MVKISKNGYYSLGLVIPKLNVRDGNFSATAPDIWLRCAFGMLSVEYFQGV